MPDGLAPPVADAVLAALLTGTGFAGYAVLSAQAHVGEPGPDGTANPAANTTRVAAGGFARSSSGSWANSAAIIWTNVPAGETYTHLSLWSAATGGTFVASGPVTGPAVTVGESYQVAGGALAVTMPVAS